MISVFLFLFFSIKVQLQAENGLWKWYDGLSLTVFCAFYIKFNLVQLREG